MSKPNETNFYIVKLTRDDLESIVELMAWVHTRSKVTLLNREKKLFAKLKDILQKLKEEK